MATKLVVRGDTWINQASPATQYGGSGQLLLNNGTNKKYALLWIPIPDLKGAVVQSAVLRVVLKGSNWSTTDHIKVDRLTAAFNESDTWNTYNTHLPSLPGPDQSDFTVGSPTADGSAKNITVTALVADAAADGNWFGFLLSTSATGDRAIYSSESAQIAYRPYLTITYAKPPAAPTNLLPASGASAQKPKLAWTSAPQTQYRVQVDRAATFNSSSGSPDYDSGWISSTNQGTDLATITPAWTTALPNDGDTRYWRVAVKNEAGAMSDYAVSSWTRHVYDTVTITFPAADNAPVDATTPTITWSLASHNEGRYQLLEDVSGYDSGEVTGSGTTSDSAQIPKGFVKSTGVTYTARVRVWDTFTRDAPGEAGYVEATRKFVYSGGTGSVAPVATLTATVDEPAIVLTWTRSSAPDEFRVFMDGVDTGVHLNPADVLVSGTTYSYRFRRAPADVTHTFNVRAHTDAAGDSTAGPSATASITPRGVWLVDEKTGIEVQFLGQGTIDMKITEDGALFLPLGQRAPVRIVNQIRGYEGQLGGTVSDQATIDDLNAIKAIPPGQGTIRLIYGSFNFPVDLGQVTVSEWPFAAGERTYQWVAEFWQVGEPWPLEE